MREVLGNPFLGGMGKDQLILTMLNQSCHGEDETMLCLRLQVLAALNGRELVLSRWEAVLEGAGACPQ